MSARLKETGRWMIRRKGSVLLLVIVLLLLLAILGTAYISTSHTDRQTSQQTLLNVQSEANFDGLSKSVAGIFVDDLNDYLGNFRGAASSGSASIGPYSATVTYPVGSIVSDPNNPLSFYESISDPPANPNLGQPLTTAAYWTAVNVANVTPRAYYCGPWNSAVAYSYEDVVISGTPSLFYYWPTSGTSSTPGSGPPGNGWNLTPKTYVPVTASYVQNWVADRIPTLGAPTGVPPLGPSQPLGVDNQPCWEYISESYNPANAPAVQSVLPGLPFESPDGSTPLALTAPAPTPLFPGYATLNGVTVPTLSNAAAAAWPPPAITMPQTTGTTVIAGDADGDGVADCLLFRIPGANYDGLTWYAGVRIVDNNSAVNVNTAWSRDQDYNFANAALSNWGFFQSNVGLLELLNPTDTIVSASPPTPPNYITLKFNQYRFNSNMGTTNYPVAGASGAANDVYDETGVVPPNVPAAPRTDFTYISQGDAFFNQSIRRIDNPGYNYDTNTTSVKRYQAIPQSDGVDLAYHFGLPNPNSGTTLLESLLPKSLTYYWNNRGNPGGTNAAFQADTPLPTTPYGGYPTEDIANWWYENYDFNTIATDGGNPSFMPLRNLVTTWNPVSNYINPVYDSGILDPGQPMDTMASFLTTEIMPLGQLMLPYYTSVGSGISPWSNTANYIAGNVVQYGGYYFISKKGTTSNYNTGNYPVPTANVVYSNGQYIFTGGYDTIDWGTWGQNKGAWNPNAVYRFNDLVTDSDGYTYISVNDNHGGAGDEPKTLLAAGALNGYPANFEHWQRQPYSQHPVKTNVNTATFRELYRAFWSAMAGNPANSCPFGTTPNSTAGFTTPSTYDHPYEVANSGAISIPWHMFKTVLRDPTAPAPTPPGSPYPPAYSMPGTFMDPSNVMALRAALAAVNTLGLRDQTQNVISRTVWLSAYVSGAGAPSAVEARVYSAVLNPVINEVFVNNNTSGGAIVDANSGGTNPNGYIAIQIYNPYSSAINMSNWQIGMIPRPAGVPYPNLVFNPATPLYTFPAGMLIPANSYIILENYNPTGAGGADANYRPANLTPPGATGPTTMPSTGYALGTTNNPNPGPPVVNNIQDVYTNGLDPLIQGGGGEMVLLRPRRADGNYTQNVISNPGTYDPMNVYNEGTPAAPNLYDLVPVDSYDFTGIPAPSNTATIAYLWSYIRPTLTNSYVAAPFDALHTSPYSTINAGSRETGTEVITEVLGNADPPTVVNSVSFENPSTGSYAGKNYFPPIQVFNAGMPGANPTITSAVNTAAPEKFPFGGFARNGDILNIPYIGSYRLRVVDQTTADAGTGAPFQPVGGVANEGTFLEMNSLPMDASLADDGDNTAVGATSTEDAYENVGRFGPLTTNAFNPSTLVPATNDWYAWSAHLFDYLTVQSNNDDYMPNFDPGFNDVGVQTAAGDSQPAYPYSNKYWQASISPSPATYTPAYGAYTANPNAVTPVNPVYNADGAATDQTTQDNVGVDGLININTASWKVLSMLPMVTQADDSTNWAIDNEALAQAIVNYRNTSGPFMSIFDLNKVLGFQTADGKFPFASAASGDPGTMGVSSATDTNFPNNPTLVTGDYRAGNMVLNRISNLITTHSDTFTVYIVIEGWQNAVLTPPTPPATTSQAQLKVTKRFAFIADRSAINADINTRFLKTLTVPNN